MRVRQLNNAHTHIYARVYARAFLMRCEFYIRAEKLCRVIIKNARRDALTAPRRAICKFIIF